LPPAQGFPKILTFEVAFFDRMCYDARRNLFREGFIVAIRKRYKDIERILTQILIADAGVFVLYMIFAGLGVTFLKVVTTIACLVASIGCLALLYMTGEMKKARSRWLVLGFAAVVVCLLVSLILNYPSPAVVAAEAISSIG
jgi:cell division protein FtsW (lipid II flippase)